MFKTTRTNIEYLNKNWVNGSGYERIILMLKNPLESFVVNPFLFISFYFVLISVVGIFYSYSFFMVGFFGVIGMHFSPFFDSSKLQDSLVKKMILIKEDK
tara:strand:- start:184 stop:483 length:300 start_codon:yes stop_codon:yes gene_type:complete